MSIYDLSFTDNNKNIIQLKTFQGKNILIVNTASHCGSTPQYADLQKIQTKELGLYDQSGEIGIKDLLESEFNKISKEGLSSYKDLYDLKTFFEELYNPNLTVSEYKSDVAKQKENLEKVLPEL